MAQIIYSTFDKSGIDRIKGLWEGLNKYHFDKSVSFKDHYSNFTFEQRKNNLFKKSGSGEMLVELAIDTSSNNPVGYCLSIVTSNPEPEGEVESLYIDPLYRGEGIGAAFMKHALDWLNSKKVVCKRIVVAAGNEEVFPFYAKYGFFPKFITLEQK
jgi:diamine N-acetyltransferase